MSSPRISAAFCSASAGPSASLIPPALPRPPVSTCALTTTWPPISSAAAPASAGAALPGGGGSLGGRRRHAPLGHRDAKAREELLALVLVEVHRRGTLAGVDHHADHLPVPYGLPTLDRQLAHDAPAVGGDLVLHLHRLDDAEHLSGLD